MNQGAQKRAVSPARSAAWLPSPQHPRVASLPRLLPPLVLYIRQQQIAEGLGQRRQHTWEWSGINSPASCSVTHVFFDRFVSETHLLYSRKGRLKAAATGMWSDAVSSAEP